jgi:hypothetical protein
MIKKLTEKQKNKRQKPNYANPVEKDGEYQQSNMKKTEHDE